MKKFLLIAGLASFISLSATSANAQHCSDCEGYFRADSHAPIGIMGDHLHKKGEFMLSYRFMKMEMEDSRDSTNDLSPVEIATTSPNRFFGTPGQPPTLRVVPTEMTTDMHMFGAMYAPSDNITLMAMGSYLDRDMDHITFQGGAGTTVLGRFTTQSTGFGDTKIGSLIRLYDDDTHHVHLNAGLSLPTGAITEEEDVLTPMGGTPRIRLPYAMQLGSGTYDVLPGVTYKGFDDKWGWGAQYSGNFRLGDNSEDYALGDKHILNLWGSYLITNAISTSIRFTGEAESQINGIDAEIVAPVQTADPENYGGRRISASLGINTVVPKGILKGHRFSAEATLPVYQNLNGPQLERDYSFTLGWSKSF